MIEKMVNSLPDSVGRVLAELKEEDATQSVWLVGSRANGTARPDSDWDLLVFSSSEPEVAPARLEGVDVIRVGPSRQTFLLEGKGSNYMISFADWQWREINEATARYTDKRFIEYPPAARDVAEPVFSRTERKAYRLWLKQA